MILHYFQCDSSALDPCQLQHLESALQPSRLTPAVLEQPILDKDDMDKVIDSVVLQMAMAEDCCDKTANDEEKKEGI